MLLTINKSDHLQDFQLLSHFLLQKTELGENNTIIYFYFSYILR